MPKLEYSGEHLRWTCSGRSDQSFRIDTDIGGAKHIAKLDLFPLVGANICRRSFRSQTTVLVQLVETYSDIVEWPASSDI